MRKELNFLKKYSLEIFKKYRGEHIAIVGDKIVAHGKDLKKVEEKAEKVSKSPVFMEIPEEEVVVYLDRIPIY